MNDDMQTKLDEIEAEAEKLAAGIYGIPEWVKCFTVDLHLGAIQRYEKKVHLNLEYKAGFIAGANHVLKELKTERTEAAAREAALSVAKATLQEICDDNGWINGERTRGPNKGKSWLEIVRETLAKLGERDGEK